MSEVLGNAKLKDIWHFEDRNFGTKWTSIFGTNFKKIFTDFFPVLFKVLSLIYFALT